jgi:hypothetical protein
MFEGAERQRTNANGPLERGDLRNHDDPEAVDRNFGELGARQIEIANSLIVVPLAPCAKSYTRHRCSETEDHNEQAPVALRICCRRRDVRRRSRPVRRDL